MVSEKLMRPAKYAEHKLLTSILNGELTPGMALPGERKLAEQIGVTRPTLRETLQRMAREGWIKIRHGKSTIVNDYMTEGGMGLLSTLARYGEYLPDTFIENFLRIRCIVLPPVAKMAVLNDPEPLYEYLENSEALELDAEEFTEYDWNLQLLMASKSGNPLFRMILNDFGFMYRTMGVIYFSDKNARELSLEYYRKLKELIKAKDSVGSENLVREIMEKAVEVWNAVYGKAK